MKKYFKKLANLESRYEIYKILKKSKSKIICEIGVDHGWNLTHLCKCKPKLAVAVDVWNVSKYYDFYSLKFHEKNYKEICRRSLQENRCILPIRLESLKAKDLFENDFFDFIYIDASHDYASVKRNILSWWPKLKRNGIMGGHDYFNGKKNIENKKLRINKKGKTLLNFGVKKAVDEFVQLHKLSICVLKDKSEIDSWFIYKI